MRVPSSKTSAPQKRANASSSLGATESCCSKFVNLRERIAVVGGRFVYLVVGGQVAHADARASPPLRVLPFKQPRRGLPALGRRLADERHVADLALAAR